MSVTKAAAIRAVELGTPFAGDVEAVYQDTWGHLAPKVKVVYSGFILWTHTIHGDIMPIDWAFKTAAGDELSGSPWFATDLSDHLCHEFNRGRNYPGGVWRWEGTFIRNKNGTSRFSGKSRPQRCVDRFPGRAR
ncbi:hypothetical protein HJB53_30185 [Rhizobium lentis]|uniref:hypothetical protein n=1 Tax=Rhizobium lentis TaxID=1138194 RepID=UPI001C83C56B|nr:hypothetical protein [Rhizobium lentis]MBX5130761.1 hypothetical protein [Rhizobium lentis]